MAVIDLHRVGEEKPTATIDVVFIHGIGGDPFATWTGGEAVEDGFWPLRLDAAISEAQVWTARYPAQLSTWFGISFPLITNSTSLLDRLTQKIGKRPIVFVCHSLGGLVAKQMLRHADGSPGQSDSKRLGENVIGIAFLGTPHLGASLASLAKSLARILRPLERFSGFTSSASELATENTYLGDLGTWFRSFVDDRKVKVIVYAETLPVRGGLMVVKNYSADPGLLGVQSVPMPLDHFQLAGPHQDGDQIPDGIIKLVRELARQSKLPKTGILSKPVKPTLRYSDATRINDGCVTMLLTSSDKPEISYYEDVSRVMTRLAALARDPAPVTSHPRFKQNLGAHHLKNLTSFKFAELNKASNRVHRLVYHNLSALAGLTAQLQRDSVSPELGTRALSSFASFAALSIIGALQGFLDINEDGKYIEHFYQYVFSQFKGAPFFESVPTGSSTGSVVFNYEYYVQARIGRSFDYYETFQMPLDVASRLYRKQIKDDRESFYTWVIPQLYLFASDESMSDNIAADHWKILLLESKGIEWEHEDSPSPWPGCIG